MKPLDLSKALSRLVEKQYDLKVEAQVTPSEPSFGDYSSNVAMQLAGRLKRNPAEIATELADNFEHPSVAGVSAVGGYLNFTMTGEFWTEQLQEIKPGFGKSNQGKGNKVEVEFISANPTGPTTIGNARGGFIGDVISNVYEALGYDVTREYYFNNAGTQIRKLVESVKVAAGAIKVANEDIQYRGDYIEELAKEFKDQITDKSDDELGVLITTKILKQYIEPAVAKMGIKFDVWFNESDLVKGGQLDDVIKRLREKGLVFDKDGAVWLDTKKLGVAREERVLVKSSGDPTYLAPDIAHYDHLFSKNKIDLSITVLGADHFDQFPSVRAAVLALNPGKEMKMAGHQWFRLMRDGKEVKISKRAGVFVTIEELIDEVTMPVARFFTIMRSNDTPMDFDLNLAKEQSQKNPYYYVMYSYVRANSILAKAKDKKLEPTKVKDLVGVSKELAKHMVTLPEVIAAVAEDFGVHKLAYWGQEAAKRFHEFYEAVPILSGKPEQAGEHLALVNLYTTIMESYFDVLGIEPLSKM